MEKEGQNIDNQSKKLRTSAVRSAVKDELNLIKRALSLHPDAWKDLAFYLYKQDNKGKKSVRIADMNEITPVLRYKYEVVDGERKKVVDEEGGTQTVMDKYIRKAERALQSNQNKHGVYIGNKYTEKVIKWSLMYVRKEGTKVQMTKQKVNNAMSKFLQL